MNSDLFFSSPRWKILEVLTTTPSSPLEISHKVNTSVAYVSQQLKLLEAAKFIERQKTGSSEKGMPRSLYSISNEVLYLTALVRGHPSKKLLYLTNYHKLILKIWLLENSDLHYFVERLYWKIEGYLPDVRAIFIDNSSNKPLIYLVSESKELKSIINTFQKETNQRIEIKIIQEADLKKISFDSICSIHDPSLILIKKEMKGGMK